MSGWNGDTDPLDGSGPDAAWADEAAAERERDVRWWLTVDETARHVRDALAVDDPAWAGRVLCDSVNRIPLVAALDRLEEMLAPPGSTGDERWDALIAGAVRYRLRLLGRPAPAWTVRAPLSAWWWPGGRGTRAVVAMQNTPPELSRLGIWFDARNFRTA